MFWAMDGVHRVNSLTVCHSKMDLKKKWATATCMFSLWEFD
jgi:hypothetical protein